MGCLYVLSLIDSFTYDGKYWAALSVCGGLPTESVGLYGEVSI